MSPNSNLLHVIHVFCLSILALHAEESVSSNRASCYIEGAPECLFNGNYNCGTCECYPNYYGKKCECIMNEHYSQLSQCKAPNSSVECSGRGTCICNECICDMPENANKVITGQWCECDNYSCARHGGEICGGHGVCECGRCACFPPWTGEACDYSATRDTAKSLD